MSTLNHRSPHRPTTSLTSAPSHPNVLAGEPDGQALAVRARHELKREQLRHLRSLTGVVALACVEAEAGLRPARQLAAWLDADTYAKMVRRASLAERVRGERAACAPPRIVSARCMEVDTEVYEACASVQFGQRVRALALRIERARSRWKVTAVELG